MPQHAQHPARLAALAAGEKKWFGPTCSRHGAGPHHTSSGQCVACNRERSALQAIAKSGRRTRYVRLADRPERQAALARGDLIYWGPLCLNGHAGKRPGLSPRYTKTTQCAACAQARAPGASAADLDLFPREATPPGGERGADTWAPLPRSQPLVHRITRRLRVLIRKVG